MMLKAKMDEESMNLTIGVLKQNIEEKNERNVDDAFEQSKKICKTVVNCDLSKL